MKKLFTLIMVLAITGVASAVILDQTNDGITVASGTEVTIAIDVQEALISLDAVITVSGPGVITAATGQSDAAANGWDFQLSYAPIGIGTQQVIIGLGDFLANGTETASVTIQANGPEDIVVSIAAGSAYGGSFTPLGASPDFIADDVVIHVPEPATMAVLGLGALLIRRKK